MTGRPAVARPSAASVRVLAPDCLAGRTALVTGAGTGIGRAVTLRLLALGAHVVGVGRRVEPLAETRASTDAPERLRVEQLDIRDRSAVATFVAGLDRLDLLVNNAGGQFVAPATAISARGFGAVLDLNLTATAHLTRTARRALAAAGGRVVTLSLSAPDRGIAGLVHSTTARAGMAALTRSLARQWAGEGIRLFCLAPGTVHTAGVAGEVPTQALDAGVRASLLGRDTGLDEGAEWVAAMGSGVFDAVSGTAVELDGGAGLVDAAASLVPPSAEEPA
ncbi:MAG: SDR family NAD(P)-dependent oxidoreductase [Streptosporangiales bacterium]|nr:SDR family NAD(P)-dependent oxidoreductase [Streptosporangiales bacterium]